MSNNKSKRDKTGTRTERGARQQDYGVYELYIGLWQFMMDGPRSLTTSEDQLHL